MNRFLAVAIVALALAGCDQFQASFDKSFNASFDKRIHNDCVTSAVGRGAAADVVERYCSCVVGQLDKLSVREKMNLRQTPDKLRAAAEACTPTSTS